LLGRKKKYQEKGMEEESLKSWKKERTRIDSAA
jgi:hypothetical protein